MALFSSHPESLQTKFVSRFNNQRVFGPVDFKIINQFANISDVE
jgi:hypothetical protein